MIDLGVFSKAVPQSSEPGNLIYMIINSLYLAMFFAISMLFYCKLLKMNSLLVEAAGVEPASEIVVSRETPCSVEFRRFRVMRSEPTRCA